MPQRVFVEARGLTMAVEDSGGTGRALLFIHGHPFDHTMWRPQLAALAGEGWRVIAPDLRGYGASDITPGKVRLDAFALDLAALLDALGIASATLVGLSMGGQIAMEFCRRFPERVDGLALAATFPRADSAEGVATRLRFADRVLAEGMADYADELLPKMLGASHRTGAVADHVLTMMRSAPPEGAAAALRGRAERDDYCATLARVAVPALVVVGDEDAFTTRDDAACMAALLRDSEFLDLPDVGHMPNLEAPEQFNAALRRLLARVEAHARAARPLPPSVALVTGASAGFGAEITRRMVRSGWQVIAVGRRLDRLHALAEECAPGRVHALQLDVSNGAAVETAVSRVVGEVGAIDCLVNNAGLALGMEPAQDADLAGWDQMIDTNCRGLAYVTRAVLPGMVARGRGHVVNLGSVAATYAYPGGNMYGATKAFVHQFSRNLRSDLHGTGVRVTLLEPGLCGGTEFSEVRFGGDAAKAAAVYAGLDPLTSADIAETVLWAVSQPPHVNINLIELMPTAQSAGGFQVHRRAQ